MSAVGTWFLAAKGLLMKRTPGMITCEEFETFIDDHLDGRLSGRERWVFGLHLAMCPHCRRYLAAYERAIEAGRSVLRADAEWLPDQVPEELVQAILAARRPDRGSPPT